MSHEMDWKTTTKLAIEEQTVDQSEQIINNSENTPLIAVL